MSTHTQGPWEIETDHDEGDDVVLIHGAADAPGLVPIATVFTVDAFPCTDDEDRESLRAEYEANARLITAAPDLLAACELAIEAIEGIAEWGEPEIKARQALIAAIAKARPS